MVWFLSLWCCGIMGETEIEEGEACDYMDNGDQNFDIDVALSYLVRVSVIF